MLPLVQLALTLSSRTIENRLSPCLLGSSRSVVPTSALIVALKYEAFLFRKFGAYWKLISARKPLF
jgi:hypothetical protein